MAVNSSISNFEAVTAEQAQSDRIAFARDLLVKFAPLLVLPLLHCLVILLADPYNLFRMPLQVGGEQGPAVPYASTINPALYRLTAFTHDPMPDILLGDSRMDAIKPPAIKKLTGRDIASLAIPGGTLETTLDTYTFAAETTRLRSVTAAISLDMFNGFRIGSEVGNVRTIHENRLLYFANQNVIDAVFKAYGRKAGLVPPTAVPGKISGAVLENVRAETRTFFEGSLKNWRKPVRYQERLKELAEDCRKNGTQLRFVILPQHDDATALIHKHGLDAEFTAMKSFLAELAPVVDLSTPSPLTADMTNFVDIIHFNERTFQVIEKLWPPQAN